MAGREGCVEKVQMLFDCNMVVRFEGRSLWVRSRNFRSIP